MSRSRKKHAIAGITTTKSEKLDKVIMHRNLRRKTKPLLKKDPDTVVFPVENEIMDKWSMGKDGKMRYEKNDKGYKKVIRK